jgi:hypothetical protein
MKTTNLKSDSSSSYLNISGMKGILILVCFLIVPALIRSQIPELKYRNELRLGIAQLFFGKMHLNYEGYTKRSNSITFVIEATYNKKKEKEITGFLIEMQPRIYILKYEINEFSDFAIEGFYFSPAVKYGSKKIVDSDYHDEITSYGASLILGIKNNILTRLTLDINAGCGFTVSDIETQRISHDYNLNVFSRGYTGFAPIGNVTFGFKF